jgi:nitric oxide reductase subunit B
MDKISPWWRYAVLAIVIGCLACLFVIAGNSYWVGPPIPERVVDTHGNTIFTSQDVKAGQNVFLKHGLMENGTIWGHGAYLGPDFSARYLHNLILHVKQALIRTDKDQFAEPLDGQQRAALKGRIYQILSTNRYDPETAVLTFTTFEAESFRKQKGYWKDFFSDPNANRGLGRKNLRDPEQLRQLTAFFAWTAWASVAHIPGKNYSYTNNFPYEPEIGNGPTSESILWSALSLIALLSGTGAVLFAFGRFHFLGWRGEESHTHPRLLLESTYGSQEAILKYFVLVSILLLFQSLAGGALAHFRAQPATFYGINLSAIFPSNALRSWHLQLAILWIATAYVGGGLFLASALGQREPKGQRRAVNILFVALVFVIVGSLTGEYLGIQQWLSKLWFWFGDQGWEYLEIGRGWQVLLAMGLVFWAILMIRAVGHTIKEPRHREITWLFLLAAFAIPVFYLPAFFFGRQSSFTVVDTWRFWIIHLWVEGFFELFATVMVAVMFYKLQMVSLKTAKRVIYLDAILFLGSGILGTGHHWYWTGQNAASMALSATFSAMEVVPLVLLTLDAADFTRLMRPVCDICGRPYALSHRWTFAFLIAVGVWNFIGAGVFGFLINLPVVSYFETGTNLTANHAHAALMGVFGMLALAFLVFVLRELSDEDQWARTRKYVACSFWGLNIGLALMVTMNLFPIGVLQMVDVIKNGYWHARGPEFSQTRMITLLEWARMPADLIFIVFGALPLTIAAVKTYIHVKKTELKR